jgi:hypothetical protein
MERRRFTREFKLEAVRLIRDCRVSYAQASHDLSLRLSRVAGVTGGGIVHDAVAWTTESKFAAIAVAVGDAGTFGGNFTLQQGHCVSHCQRPLLDALSSRALSKELATSGFGISEVARRLS